MVMEVIDQKDLQKLQKQITRRAYAGEHKTAAGYLKWNNPLIAKICERLAMKGLKDYEIADLLDIRQSSFSIVKNKYPDIGEAVIEGRSKATQKIVAALYKRATGYDYYEETLDKDGNVRKLKKHMPSNPVCQLFWLTNRDPENWKHRAELTDSNRQNGIGRSSETPETDKIKRLYGRVFGEDTDGTVRECSFSDETSRGDSQGPGDEGDIRGDVSAESADSIQDDVLDIPAKECTEQV